MDQQSYRITGLCPLIMHSGKGVDCTNPYARELKRLATNKTTKNTDDGQEAISRCEWFMGLYHDGTDAIDPDGNISISEGAKIILPATNLEAMIIEGSKKHKLGKTFKAGMFIEQDFPLVYPGPQNPRDMWDSGTFVNRTQVRNQAARIMRTRPIFRTWKCEFTVTINKELMDEQSVFQALTITGQQIGICDWRPRFGRFEVSRV